MKVMILVRGSSNRGKSESIKRLARSLPFSSFIRPWQNDDYDSYVIGKVKDKVGKVHIVGIENQGDPNSCQKEWIEACIAEDSEIIVATCRSHGQTLIDAYQLANDNGYEVVEVTTLFHVGGPVVSNSIDLRDVFAEYMQDLIFKCIE